MPIPAVSGQVHALRAKGYVNTWLKLEDGADREGFESRLALAADEGDASSGAALRRILAMKGVDLKLTVAQVRTLQHMARHADGKPVRLTSYSLLQLCDTWLKAQRVRK